MCNVKLNGLIAISFAALSIVNGSVAAEPHRRSSNVCKGSLTSAYKSCRLDANEEFALATGKCLNVPSRSERKRCANEAKREQREAAEVCKESRAFRKDLCKDFGPGAYAPEIVVSNFLSPEQAAASPNPYLPLVPGTIWKYEGGGESIVVTVTIIQHDVK